MTMETSTMDVEGLWNDLHAELLAFARPRLGSATEAEDVLQVAFLRAHRHLESGTVPTNPRAWLYQIVRNLSVDSYRRSSRQRELMEPDMHQELEALEDTSSLEPDEGVHATLARMLPRFIERLPEPYREALQLIEIEGLTQAQAADHVGLSLSGMKSRVQRARKKLSAALHQCCEFGLDARNRVVSCSTREGQEDCEPPSLCSLTGQTPH